MREADMSKMKEEWVYVVLARWAGEYTVENVYGSRKLADKKAEWLRERGVDTRIYPCTITRQPIIAKAR